MMNPYKLPFTHVLPTEPRSRRCSAQSPVGRLKGLSPSFSKTFATAWRWSFCASVARLFSDEMAIQLTTSAGLFAPKR